MKVAILGYGTVGGGVAQVLTENRAEVAVSAWEEVDLGYILDLRDFPDDLHADKVVHDIETILNDDGVKVVCETMGGIEPAYTFSRRFLEKGVSVCTSNKELVAEKGPELVEIARKNKCSYLFEASVGGGIPILRQLNTSLLHERIDSVTGILNGTTNYILTKMDLNGAEFDTVLQKAQERGYAERDPSADVEGADACRKTAILASLISGTFVRYGDIPTEGITKITPDDMAYAHTMHRTIRLIGSVNRSPEGIDAIVAPFFVSRDHPLAGVSGVYNAILVHGNMLGNTMYYGRGAGREATASAVVADMIYAIQHIGRHIPVNLHDEPARMRKRDDIKRRFFVRTDASERELAQQAFESCWLTDVGARGMEDEYAFTTDEMTEGSFREAFAKLQRAKGYFRLL